MNTHKDLNVWKESMDLVESIYLLTKSFPKEELYGLTSQMRRSAISIPSNIAEGAARKGDKEFIRFLYIALGSLSELETQILIAKRLSYLTNKEILCQITQLGKMLINLIKFRKSNIK